MAGRAHAWRSAAADAAVEEALRGIGREVGALRVPGLAGVVLGGGYGRGEGGVWPDGKLSNDLDFFAVTEKGAGEGAAAAAARALEPLGKKWSAALEVDVDFAAKTPERLWKDRERLMVQELVRGYFDAWGAGGEALFAELPRRAPEELPWSEAARLLANRGAGLLLAREAGRSAEFVARNIAKGVLGAGDARLIAGGGYRWRAEDRAEALGEEPYREALVWKFRPRDAAPCAWEAARDAWFAAEAEVRRAGGTPRRSWREAARWVARRRTIGEWRTLGQDPVVRVLDGIARALRTPDAAFPAALKLDWKVFN